MKPSDPYAILGVSRSATQQEIRAAYHALVKRYHPDKHRGNPLESLASEKLAEVNHAYAQLSTPTRVSSHTAETSPRNAVGWPPLKKAAWTAFVLVILIRLGPLVIRLLWAAARLAFGAVVALRGTPVLAIAILVIVVLGVRAYGKRRR